MGVILHFSTGQNLVKKIVRKDKYWHNQLIKGFCTGQNLLKKILRKDKYWRNWKKNFLIDPLNTNVIYRDSLTLSFLCNMARLLNFSQILKVLSCKMIDSSIQKHPWVCSMKKLFLEISQYSQENTCDFRFSPLLQLNYSKFSFVVCFALLEFFRFFLFSAHLWRSSLNLQHECQTQATRVRHEWKILILITTSLKTYFHTLIFIIWQVKDYNERNNLILRTSFWKCLVSMPKCV